MPKISVIGAGFVGATVAQRIVERDLADVVLVDVVDGLAAGKALDMMESAPLEGFGHKIVGTTNYELTANSDVVVITAGLARKPGMSRDDLMMKNAEIISDVVSKVAPISKKAILITVTNPLDVMTWLAWRRSGFPKERVIGMAGVLDSARYRYFISEKLGVAAKHVEAMVLGGHGDDMVPLAAHTTVHGKPILEKLSQAELNELIVRTRNGGAEIVALLKTGSAWYAPASSVVEMIESILKNDRKILPCCVKMEGAFGLMDTFCGVPVMLGAAGMERVVELPISEDEKKALHQSANHVKESILKLSGALNLSFS
jgi:malate dehydrogenase